MYFNIANLDRYNMVLGMLFLTTVFISMDRHTQPYPKRRYRRTCAGAAREMLRVRRVELMKLLAGANDLCQHLHLSRLRLWQQLELHWLRQPHQA